MKHKYISLTRTVMLSSLLLGRITLRPLLWFFIVEMFSLRSSSSAPSLNCCCRCGQSLRLFLNALLWNSACLYPLLEKNGLNQPKWLSSISWSYSLADFSGFIGSWSHWETWQLDHCGDNKYNNNKDNRCSCVDLRDLD